MCLLSSYPPRLVPRPPHRPHHPPRRRSAQRLRDQPNAKSSHPPTPYARCTPAKLSSSTAPLPPIHLDAVRWWREPHLADLVQTGLNGDPQAPDGLVTCPLTATKARGTGGPVDMATLDSALAQLPNPSRPATRPAQAHKVSTLSDERQTGSCPFSTPTTRPANPPAKRELTSDPSVTRVSGRCELCLRQLAPGQGRRDTRGARVIVRCAPSCTELRRANPIKERP